MAERLNRVGLKGIAFVGTIFMTVLTGMVWKYTIERFTWQGISIKNDSLGINFLWFLFTVLSAYIICKTCGLLKHRTIHIIAILLTLGLTGGMLYLIEAASADVIVADQAQVILGAEWWFDGRYEDIYNDSYFRVYPYQLQVSKFFGQIIHVFGKPIWESLKLLQCVNAACVGITFYIGLCIVWKLFKDVKVEVLYLLLAVPFAPMYIYALFIYGEAMGTCSAVTAIYFYVLISQEKQQRKWQVVLYWGGMALCLWMAYFLRPGFLIVWIGILLIVFLTCLRKKNWWHILYVLVVLAVIFGGQRMYYRSIGEKTGFSLDKGAPVVYLCIAMGMQGGEEIADDPGSYNGYNLMTFIDNKYDVEASIEQAKADIYRSFTEFLAQPERMYRFYKSKILNQWAEPSYSAFSSTGMMSEPEQWVIDCWYNEQHDFLYNCLNHYQSIAYMLILVYFLGLFQKEGKEVRYLPGLILIGEILFSVIWESKSRYVYPYIVIAIPCMAVGMKHCIDGIDLLIKVVRKKHGAVGKNE